MEPNQNNVRVLDPEDIYALYERGQATESQKSMLQFDATTGHAAIVRTNEEAAAQPGNTSLRKVRAWY